jgi:hypothetical protein
MKAYNTADELANYFTNTDATVEVSGNTITLGNAPSSGGAQMLPGGMGGLQAVADFDGEANITHHDGYVTIECEPSENDLWAW